MVCCFENAGDIFQSMIDSCHFILDILTNIQQIPKPNEQEGMSIGWPSSETNMDKLKALHEEIKSKM